MEHDPSFDFLFEAASAGLELQKQIHDSERTSKDAMDASIAGFDVQTVAGKSLDELETLQTNAVRTVNLLAQTRALKKTLATKEQEVNDALADTPLSVRVLSGEGRKLIAHTYFSSGAVGSRQQEFGPLERTHRNGMFRTALLGQNALVLYPQWLSGQQMDRRNILAPIVRDDGTPNIAVERRERTWRDRFGLRGPVSVVALMPPIAEQYRRWAPRDLPRLRQLATEL